MLKSNQEGQFAPTFALREAHPTHLSLRQNGRWTAPNPIASTAEERKGGMTVYTHTVTWDGPYPTRYRLVQEEKPIYEAHL